MMNRRQFFAGLAALVAAPIVALKKYRPAPPITRELLQEVELEFPPAYREALERHLARDLAERPFVIVTETITREEFARRFPAPDPQAPFTFPPYAVRPIKAARFS